VFSGGYIRDIIKANKMQLKRPRSVEIEYTHPFYHCCSIDTYHRVAGAYFAQEDD